MLWVWTISSLIIPRENERPRSSGSVVFDPCATHPKHLRNGGSWSPRASHLPCQEGYLYVGSLETPKVEQVRDLPLGED